MSRTWNERRRVALERDEHVMINLEYRRRLSVAKRALDKNEKQEIRLAVYDKLACYGG